MITDCDIERSELMSKRIRHVQRPHPSCQPDPIEVSKEVRSNYHLTAVTLFIPLIAAIRSYSIYELGYCKKKLSRLPVHRKVPIR